MNQSLKLCRKQKVELQTIIIIPAFIIARIFTFIKIFISLYSFMLLSGVLSVQPAELPLAFLAGSSSGNKLPQLLSGNVFISPLLLKDSFAEYRILG